MKRIIRTLTILSLIFTLACDDGEHVLAVVNGKKVTQKEFDAYLMLKHIPGQDQKRREAALKEFLQREGLAAVIEKEGKLDKATIDAEVNEFRKEMIISRYFDQFLTDQVSEEGVQSMYGTEATKYETKKVHVAHILFRTNTRMSEEQRSAKLTSAQEVHSKIQAGESFEELAKQFSEDKISGSRGGDLGWIKEGTIDERFSKRAFELKAGTVTEPFETPFGFHLLKVIEEPKTVRRPLGAVAGEIRYRLRNEAKDKELKRLEGAVKVDTKKSYDEKLTPKKEAVSRPTIPTPGAFPSMPDQPQAPSDAGSDPSLQEEKAAGAAVAPSDAPEPSAPSATAPPKTGAKGAEPAPKVVAPATAPKATAPTPPPVAPAPTPAPTPSPAPAAPETP